MHQRRAQPGKSTNKKYLWSYI